jgi:hypothetical protein
MTPTPYISATERIYLELSRPEAPQPKPASVAAEKPELTRADVDAIIQRTRTASPQELQHIIDHAKDYRLTEGARNQIGCDLSILMAQRARNMNERRDDPGARFISQTLGLLPTPFGLVARSFIDDLLRDGARNISRRKRHQPPNCGCWSGQRAILWQAQSDHGNKSPESWAAARICEVLEDLEFSSRPQRGPGVV